MTYRPRTRIRTHKLRRTAIVVACLSALVLTASSPANAIVGGALVPTTAVQPASTPKVVGGTDAGAHAYGWMVRLSIGCDGALVAPRVVLTAGHCVAGTGRNTTIQATAGAADLNSVRAITIDSTYVQRAAGFKDAMKGNDWAVIQLAGPLTDPLLALPSSAAYDKGLFRVVGWGATRENGTQQTKLRSALVPFVSDAACAKAYHGDPFVKSQMICAGNLARGGVDACQGDSGGPLVRRDSAGAYVEVGIVGWGLGCARRGFPGVYTQVSTFLPAIKAAIAKLS